jgi:hypothetical protein
VAFNRFLAKEPDWEAYPELLPIKDLAEEEEFSELHKVVVDWYRSIWQGN